MSNAFTPTASVEAVAVPKPRDIGGFDVRRALPSVERRMVGPFVFLDQMGPATFEPGHGIDVRPHPHIGLATVTYLIEGTIVHRDSLGTILPIEPGAVNLMTAGRGIVHSERADPELRKGRQRLYGLQMWVALPECDEEMEPAFSHTPANALPVVRRDGATVRIVAGTVLGATSPVETRSPLFFADVSLDAGASLALDAPYAERAAYLLEGDVEVDGVRFEPGRLLAFKEGASVVLRAAGGPARFAVLGGESVGDRRLWWNFVSSRPERIEQAKADWKRDRFGVQVPGETEFIPLPE